MIVTQREREREAETQAEGEAGSMHRKPDVGFDPGSPGSRPGPKALPNRCTTQGSRSGAILLIYLNFSSFSCKMKIIRLLSL